MSGSDSGSDSGSRNVKGFLVVAIRGVGMEQRLVDPGRGGGTEQRRVTGRRRRDGVEAGDPGRVGETEQRLGDRAEANHTFDAVTGALAQMPPMPERAIESKPQ